jgi:probable poly-beta-1,6-N-acetyl-D-glucosamine export protein
MQKTRNGLNEIYFLSAIACLILVGVQVFEMFALKGTLSFSEIASFSNPIGQIGVMMFVVIFGAFLFNRSCSKGKADAQSGLGKVIVQSALWISLYLILLLAMAMKGELVGKGMLVDFEMGSSFNHSYVLLAVLQFLMIYPILKLVKSKTGWSMLLIVSGIVNVYFLTESIQGTSAISEILEHPAFLTHWIFFFVFGGFLAYYWEKVQFLTKKLNWVGFGTLVGLIGLTVINSKSNGFIEQSVWMMLAIPLITVSLLAVYHFVERNILLNLFLAAIGKSALGIFLIFPIVIFAYSNVLPDWMFGSEYFVLVFSLVIGTSVFVSRVLELFPGNYEVKRYRFKKPYLMKDKALRLN